MKNIEALIIKRKTSKKHKSYCFKQFSTPYLIIYPLMILYWCYDKIKDKILSLCKWNKRRADRIITEEIIRHGELKDGIIYYYWRTWGNWWYNKHKGHLKDRIFCRKFNDKITDYFVHEYELNGYTSKVEYDGDWYNFTFTKNN